MLTVLTVFSALVLLRTLGIEITFGSLLAGRQHFLFDQHPAGHENPPPDMDMLSNRAWLEHNASDLLRLCAESARDDISRPTAWAKNPRALAGRLRRAQTFLRTLGIEITFFREGRTGTRMIRVSTSAENIVSTVSIVSAARGNGSRGDQAILAGVRE